MVMGTGGNEASTVILAVVCKGWYKVPKVDR